MMKVIRNALIVPIETQPVPGPLRSPDVWRIDLPDVNDDAAVVSGGHGGGGGEEVEGAEFLLNGQGSREASLGGLVLRWVNILLSISHYVYGKDCITDQDQ